MDTREIYLDIIDMIKDRQALIYKAIEEITLFFDSEDYLQKELNITVLTSIEATTEEYNTCAFSIWKTLYRERPEFFIFLPDNTRIQILYYYTVFAKATGEDLINFSADKALQFGYNPVVIEKRREIALNLIK